MTTSRNPYDTHHEAVISRAKFDACMSSSFRRVKAYVRTDVETESRFLLS